MAVVVVVGGVVVVGAMGVVVVAVIAVVEVGVVVQISAGESWNLPSVIWLRCAEATHAFVHSVW